MVWLAVTAAVAGAFSWLWNPTAILGGTRKCRWAKCHRLGHAAPVQDPRWVLGLVLLGIGMSLNVYALASAPLTVVQPIGAIALVITTIVNGREHNIRMNRPTILAITACMVGSIGFVILAIQVSAESHEITLSRKWSPCCCWQWWSWFLAAR